MTTFTGKRVNPLDLRLEDIEFRDVAHHLACINRFCGAASVPITVAQHCVFVSKIVTEIYRHEHCGLQGLFHDASEYLLGDVVKWMKATQMYGEYRRLEADVQWKIYRRFNIPFAECECIKRADVLAVRYEAFRYMPRIDVPDGNEMKYPPITMAENFALGSYEAWTWDRAEQEFHSRFAELTANQT